MPPGDSDAPPPAQAPNPYLLPNPYVQGPQGQAPYAQGPYAQAPYGAPTPTGWSPKARIWLGIFALGGFMIAFDGGRDVLRPKDSAPRHVTAAEAARLPEGSWVEITGTLNVDSAREVKGIFRSSGVFLLQFEGEGPSPVLVTNTTRTPAFAELASKGWLLDVKRKVSDAGADEDADRPPTPAVVALFTEPQTFRGVLFKPGGQPMVKSDQTEIDDEKVEVAGYCRESGIHCTAEKMVLVTGESPRSRVLGIGQVLLGLAIGGLLVFLTIFGGRPKVASA